MTPADATLADPNPPAAAAPGRIEAEMAATWATPPGLLGALASVDAKTIGKRYIVTGIAFFLLAGLLAAAMRTQLARPSNGLIGPDKYDQIFTVHGATMMFLFAVPIMEAMGLFLVPLMIGSRSMAFPRLNAFSYWMYLAGGAFLWIAFVLNTGPDVGWFDYVPLGGPQYGIGKRPDVWAQMITFTEVSAMAAAASTAVTILKMRSPGMTLARMPIFVWSVLVTAFMVMLAMPAVMVASTFLICDRLLGTHFYNYAEGGSNLLFQHLFWFFGHPEVYIIFIPGLGMVSEIVQTFCRRPVFGYPAVVLSMLATGFLAFGLWVHHMFATGLPHMGDSFYTAASMTIALPSGIQIFCWLATMWDGKPRLATPMLFVVGFIITFVLGGLSGVMLASVPLDTQVHDTYFVVAHFHYVLIGGAVLPLLGGLYYWFPKATGRMPYEPAGKTAFWLIFAGFNTAFFPMHFLGLMGMPRRVYTYPPGMGWDSLNLVSTLGAYILAAGVAVYVLNLIVSIRRGAVAGPNPWAAPGLEWATASPPPAYNFAQPPLIDSRTALWTSPGRLTLLSGLATSEREVLLTSLVDARPDVREGSPRPTLWPFVTMLVVTALFIGSIFDEWWIVWLGLPFALCIIGWFWPKTGHSVKLPPPDPEAPPPGALA